MRTFENNTEFTLTGKELNALQFQAIEDWVSNSKQRLRKNIYYGSNCPMCAKDVKATKLDLAKNMISTLDSLYQLNKKYPQSQFHTNEIYFGWKVRSNVIGKLKHWGFVIQHKQGMYTITQDGIRFMENDLYTNSYNYIYQDKKIRPNDEIPQVKLEDLVWKYNLKNIQL